MATSPVVGEAEAAAWSFLISLSSFCTLHNPLRRVSSPPQAPTDTTVSPSSDILRSFPNHRQSLIPKERGSEDEWILTNKYKPPETKYSRLYFVNRGANEGKKSRQGGCKQPPSNTVSSLYAILEAVKVSSNRYRKQGGMGRNHTQSP
uniref:Uncharacterized protein n=1 Tax=Vespula pensylvanica TaxID=30213 RepID=A0A834PDI6_VESPE|nr:hypothetical protein H0235_003730 [Vespula pensylvanica]